MYVDVYLEEKKKIGFKSIGEILNIIIREQPDFEEILRKHIDFLKESFRKTERRRE
jgi:phage terminase Nu1 subunit (DNA packaging protein)